MTDKICVATSDNECHELGCCDCCENGESVVERLRAAHVELIAAVGDVIATIDPVLCSSEYKRLWDAFEPFDRDESTST